MCALALLVSGALARLRKPLLSSTPESGRLPPRRVWLAHPAYPALALFLAGTLLACVAWALGHAYVASTDSAFMEGYTEIMDELERRDGDRDGALGRDRAFREAETAATFYYALAIDALVVDGR